MVLKSVRLQQRVIKGASLKPFLRFLYYNVVMDEKVFKRIEKKYLLDKKQKAAILKILQPKMKEDRYFTSEVLNIYFDTKGYDLIIKSIENPDFKEKLRARSYGGYDKVFFEIKTKMRTGEYRVGNKRRFLITHKDFQKFLKGDCTAAEAAAMKVEKAEDLQIAREVDYMISYFQLEPKILVYYTRESYAGEQGLRITFDENLSYRNTDLSFVRKASDKKYFKGDKNIIMEIKAHEVMPLWLVQGLSEIKAYPARFSKIGKIYELIRKEQ